MEYTETDLIKYRKRMRGAAIFFMIISAIGAAGALVLVFGNSDLISDDDLIGKVVVAIGTIAGAAAAWNGSRVGAITVVLIQLFSPLIGGLGITELAATEWIKSIFYVGLATFMTVNAFRYVSVAEQINGDLGGNVIVRWAGTLLNGGIVAFIGLGVAILANGATTTVLKGSEIPPDQIEWLRTQGFLLSTEKPLYFYVDGVFSIESGGSLLTDKYVGGWAKDGDEIWSSWIELGQVCDVEVRNEGSWSEDAIYFVHDPGKQNSIELWLSIENDVHKRMISRLKSINARKMKPEIQSFCDENRAIDWVEVAAMNGIHNDLVGADSVSDEQLAWLHDKKYLLDNEQVIFFYSHGTYHIDEGGVLLTDRYLGGWYDKDGEVTGWWAELGEICAMERLEEEATDTHAYYRVIALENGEIDLYLPAAGENIERLVERVRTMSASSSSEEQKSICATALNAPDTTMSD